MRAGLLLAFLAFLACRAAKAMRMDPDGGYRDIVIKVAGDKSVPEEMCPKIISNIKVSCYRSIVVTSIVGGYHRALWV